MKNDVGGENPDDSPEVREWKKAWKNFVNAGGAEPGDHPDGPDHLYNSDRQAFIQQNTTDAQSGGSGSDDD